MSQFSFHKVVSRLPDTLVPNSIYAVRVGEGFDLYISDVTGRTAHKINQTSTNAEATTGATVSDVHYWRDINRKYVQSRGTGLITNGTALMQDNTNFSGFVFDNSDTQTGFGMFVNDKRNADVTIDEFIPVDLNAAYEFSFWAKSVKAGDNNLAYAYLSCYDIDGNVILPQHLPQVTFRITDDVVNGNQVTIHADDRQAFLTVWNRIRNSTVGFFGNGEYESKGGYDYHANGINYSQEIYNTKPIAFRNVSYDTGTGVLSGLPTFSHPKSKKLMLSISGGTYVYWLSKAEPPLANHVIPNVWTQYKLRFIPKDIVRAGTAMIKVGWLLNRGNSETHATGISNVQMKEVLNDNP